MKPFLSIIVPYHNEEMWLLRRCINSLLFIPRIVPVEIWIIDDGSREDKVCQWVGEQAMDFLHAYRQENQGPGGARNTGIEKSCGEYVTFVDADDYILFGPYIEMLKKLRDKKPDIMEQEVRAHFEGSAAKYMMEHRISTNCYDYIIKRHLLEDLHFTPGICHENEEFCVRLHLLRAHLLTVNYSAYHYNFHEDSISNSVQERLLNKRFDDYLLVMSRLKQLKVHAPQSMALRRQLNLMSQHFVHELMRDTTGNDFTNRHLRQLRELELYPLRTNWQGGRTFFFRMMTQKPKLVNAFTPVYKLWNNFYDGARQKRAFTAYADINDAEEA